ncbi:DUF1376 domain-containing protein [Cupriavidus sp. YAF13]|uniref:DUF1376 domain-containing protein n=1 Tax=Cupriavidus sp. YAF13 TaxID=3233075 RepID=UPI003F93D0D5
MNHEHQPLTPSDCDLRDFQFMPLDVVRLRDSDLAALEDPAACWAAVLLWCAAWHQLPAASLPDDDRVLSQLAGFGRVVREWQKVREGALRGWIKCSDGRLYHPVVAEKAREAWHSKVEQRWKTECARIKKHNQRHGTSVPFPTLEQFMSSGRSRIVPRDKPDMSTGTEDDCPGFVPRETSSKGQGEGQGQLTKSNSGGVGSSNVVDPVDNSASPPPLSADEIGNHLLQLEAERGKSLALSSRAHEALLRLAGRHIAMPVLLRAHALACARRAADQDASPVNPGFLEPFVDEALAELRSAPPAAGWDETRDGVRAKAAELDVPPQPDEEPWHWFRLRVIKAAGDPHLIEREVSKAERMNPNEHERVYRLMYGVAPGQRAA